MYSIFNEGKSVVAERFIRTLKNKIFKHMTTILKNVHFDVLEDIVTKYNNTVHKTIIMKPINVTKDPKFKDGDHNVLYLKFLSTKTFLLKDMLLIG